MKLNRLAGAFVAAVVTLGATLSLAPAASAQEKPAKTRSLATVLAADRDTFDRRAWDYDIVFQAALAVLEAKPSSPVKVLTEGSTPVTAFVPNDRAFRKLYHSVTGDWVRKESKVFSGLVKTFGVDTIEAVLLYHVVPGATIDYRTALKSDGAALPTALGAPVTVDVRGWWKWRYVSLVDADPDARNAVVTRPNINKGNAQIAHGIDRVLRPIDL